MEPSSKYIFLICTLAFFQFLGTPPALLPQGLILLLLLHSSPLLTSLNSHRFSDQPSLTPQTRRSPIYHTLLALRRPSDVHHRALAIICVMD